MNAINDDESAPAIVDCDILEAAKENIQPLAAGRRVTSLATVLQTPHAQRESKLAATRHRLRLNVQFALQDEDDDPLEGYCRFVYWTIDNYPQGPCAESGLLELLEEATRVLKDDRGGKWRGEVKYLKLWVLYSTFVDHPEIIFKFLLANEIGTNLALFYEEYAVALERNGRRADADAAYMLGIARQATPLDRLKSRHREFQKRMMTAAPLPPPAPTPEVGPSSSRRPALATTSMPSTSGAIRPRPPPSDTRPTTASSSNSRIPVYVDGTDSAQEPEASPWPELGTRKSRIKENVPEVRKMAGTIIKQPGRAQRIASGPVKSKIVPYRDPPAGSDSMPSPPDPAPRTIGRTPQSLENAFRKEESIPSTPSFTPYRDEPVDGDVNSPSPAGTSADSVMRVKMIGKKGLVMTSEAEALRKNPLKNYTMADESL